MIIQRPKIHSRGGFAGTSTMVPAQSRIAFSHMCANNVAVTTPHHNAQNKYRKLNKPAMKVSDSIQPQPQRCAAEHVDTKQVFILKGAASGPLARATQHHMAAPASPSGERALCAPQARARAACTFASKQPRCPSLRNGDK